jgi:hypothetical protein
MRRLPAIESYPKVSVMVCALPYSEDVAVSSLKLWAFSSHGPLWGDPQTFGLGKITSVSSWPVRPQ